MPLQIAFIKAKASVVTEIVRADGSASRFDFPNKGPVPHDFTHLVVEEALDFRRGFWGLVAGGAEPAAVAAMASAAGHPSAKRASPPDASIVELLQAERVVECFEADLWGGPTDPATFRSVVEAACAASYVPAPALADEAIAAVRTRIAAFDRDWRPAPVGARFACVWKA